MSTNRRLQRQFADRNSPDVRGPGAGPRQSAIPLKMGLSKVMSIHENLNLMELRSKLQHCAFTMQQLDAVLLHACYIPVTVYQEPAMPLLLLLLLLLLMMMMMSPHHFIDPSTPSPVSSSPNIYRFPKCRPSFAIQSFTNLPALLLGPWFSALRLSPAVCVWWVTAVSVREYACNMINVVGHRTSFDAVQP